MTQYPIYTQFNGDIVSPYGNILLTDLVRNLLWALELELKYRDHLSASHYLALAESDMNTYIEVYDYIALCHKK